MGCVGGGGIFCYDFSSPSITNCIITKNLVDCTSADGSYCPNPSGGGGIYCDLECFPIITNCTINKNSAKFFDCINCDTCGGGIRATSDSNPKITNCILWGDYPDEIAIDEFFDTPTLVTYSNIQGGYGGEGNIDKDPLFIDSNGGDYHIQPGSPCIDTGTNAGAPPKDKDYVSRPQDGDGNGTALCDMGAYENLPKLKILSDNTWKSYDIEQPGWETHGFDDSEWRYACAPYPHKPDIPPSSWIPGTQALFMWDRADCPSPDGTEGPVKAWFRKPFTFNLPLNYIIVKASVVVAADDDFDFYVNDSKVYSDWNGVVWGGPYIIDLKSYLVTGENLFAMYAKDSYGDWEWALVDTTIEMRNLDFDNNGCVDRDDLSIILSDIRGSAPHDLSFDLNGDGEVNIADARKLVVHFTNPRGESCNN